MKSEDTPERLRFLGLPFLTALFFAVHPIHTESVTWIKNRSDLLVLLFFLSSILLFIKYTLQDGIRSRIVLYSAALFCFVLALLSKGMALPLPLVLILYILCFLSETKYTRTMTETSPFFGVMILYFVFKMTLLKMEASSGYIAKVGLYTHILVVLKTIGCYLKLLILPINLNADRLLGVPKSFFEPAVLSSAVALVFVLIIIVRSSKYSKLLSFAILWILLTLLPASNIAILFGRPIAEQRLYMPSLGFCLLLAMGISELASLESRFLSRNGLKNLAALFSILILVFYSLTTIRRNPDWRDSVTFWSKTLESSPNSPRAHNNLGAAYENMGRKEEAVALYKKAIEINPNYADAYHNLGFAYEDMGRKEEAVALYKKTIEINPDYANTHYNLSNAYYALEKKEEAIYSFKKAIEINSSYAEAYNNLGGVYYDIGRKEEAIALFKKSMEIDPEYAEPYYNLGVAHDSSGRYRDAVVCYQKAIELNPDRVEAYNNLGAVYRDLGRYEEAITYFKKAINLKPDFVLAHKNLALTYYDRKLFPLAKSKWEEVLRIDPDNVAAKENLESLR